MPTAWNAYNNIVLFLITMPTAKNVQKVSLQQLLCYIANSSWQNNDSFYKAYYVMKIINI